ncbi:MAG: VWA domain-containing protein [Clostridia bacterium]|nr:VWA domain-containing protein [Clostridia bacterium]
MADNETFDFDSFDFGEFDNLDTGVNVQRQPVVTPDVSHIVTSLKKRAMVVIFVVDISGSMKGARIGAVNDAIRNVLPELKKREKSSTSAEIKVAILEFSTNARWRTLIPEPVSTFRFTDITDVYGGTNYGKAFEKLNEKPSADQFMSATAGAYTPLIVFMTDGKPSDMGLYHEYLNELKKNKWFRYSTRVGIAIEEGALSPECRRVLTEFTDNEKNVYEAKNTVVLARQIRLVTLTGVDTVTHQGSVQNAAPPQTPASKSHADRSDRFDLGTPPPIGMSSGAPAPAAPETASPTLPIDEIDWDNDFYF